MRVMTIASAIGWAAIALSTSGCGEESESGGTCEPPEGAYLAQWTERDGDCGPLPDSVWVLGQDGPSSDSSGCSGARSVSEDGCTVTVDMECPLTDDLGRVIGAATYTGELERDDGDGKLGGLLSISATLNDGYQCFSTYTVRATKR